MKSAVSHGSAPHDLGRDDETPDGDFYTKPRFVDHLDSCALETVEQIYGRLIPAGSTILDLMAGPDSHLGKVNDPAMVVGLGLNKTELEANPVLSEHVIHDLNSDPRLPFPDNRFDVVVNTVSVDYLTQPLEVFREVSRVLKPDGLFIVVFSNRMFPPKAVNVWKASTEKQRVELVRRFFTLSGRFAIQGYQESIRKTKTQGRQVLRTRNPERSDLRGLGQAYKQNNQFRELSGISFRQLEPDGTSTQSSNDTTGHLSLLDSSSE